MFEWNIDKEEKKTQTKLTVIILLSNTIPLMQILTKRDIGYEGQRIAIAFMSYLYQKSIYFAEEIMKEW